MRKRRPPLDTRVVARHRSRTDNFEHLKLRGGFWEIELEATGNLFEVSLNLGGRGIRIRRDGRVW